MIEKLFRKINPEDVRGNVFSMIGNDWMLITAGKRNHYNMMTASWGSAGVLWKKPVIFVFIRPQRYTYEFIEKQANFTVSFFNEEYRDLLNLCGTTSGRDPLWKHLLELLPLKKQSSLWSAGKFTTMI